MSLTLKKKLNQNTSGVAPLVVLVVVGLLGIGALATYQITQKPDVTYNVEDAGISFAGLGIDPAIVLVLGIVIVFVVVLIARRNPN